MAMAASAAGPAGPEVMTPRALALVEEGRGTCAPCRRVTDRYASHESHVRAAPGTSSALGHCSPMQRSTLCPSDCVLTVEAYKLVSLVSGMSGMFHAVCLDVAMLVLYVPRCTQQRRAHFAHSSWQPLVGSWYPSFQQHYHVSIYITVRAGAEV